MRCMSDRVCLSKGEKGQGSKSKLLPCSVAAFFEDSQSLSEWEPGGWGCLSNESYWTQCCYPAGHSYGFCFYFYLSVCPGAQGLTRPLWHLHLAMGNTAVDANNCPEPHIGIWEGKVYRHHLEYWWDFSWPSPRKNPTVRRCSSLSHQGSSLSANWWDQAFRLGC